MLQYFAVAKKFMNKRGGVSRFSNELFLSHSAENFRTGTLCYINFEYRKSLYKRGGRVSNCSIEKCLSHSAESFRRRILYCCINFGNRKCLDKKGWEFQGIPSKILCLTVPKKFVGDPFAVAIISGIENFGQDGGDGSIKIFQRFFLSHTAENLRQESFTVALLSGIGKVWIGREEYQDFPSKISCLTVPKVFVDESFTVAVNSGTGKVWI